jgi:hypothetical protein
MSHHTAPTPRYRQPFPHFVWQHYLHPFERELLYGEITIPILKNKGETCMVQEPSHVKQLSPIHVSKIGLKMVPITAVNKAGKWPGIKL